MPNDPLDELTFEDMMQDFVPDPIITFGKHRGKYAHQVDVPYLTWVVGQEWLKEPLKSEIRRHLNKRKDEPCRS